MYVVSIPISGLYRLPGPVDANPYSRQGEPNEVISRLATNHDRPTEVNGHDGDLSTEKTQTYGLLRTGVYGDQNDWVAT